MTRFSDDRGSLAIFTDSCIQRVKWVADVSGRYDRLSLHPLTYKI